MKTLTRAIFLFILLAFAPGASARSPPQIFVRGYVFAQVSSGPQLFTSIGLQKTHDVALPHANVTLVDARDASKIITADISDLSGHFTIKAPPGVFLLCVKAKGFTDNCSDGRIVASRDVGHILLRPAVVEGKATAPVFGNLTLHDASRAREFEPMFGVNAYPTIEAKNSRGVFYKGYVNNSGGYIVPNVPIGDDFVLTAKIENETLERKIPKEAMPLPNTAYQFTFQFANFPPKVRLVSASSAGTLVQVAAPGSMVKIHAVTSDPDNDALVYRWLTPDLDVATAPSASPDLDWKAPSQNGSYTIRVLVGDGRGGYSPGYINLDVGSTARFSGLVADQNGKPVLGASFDVNGRATNATASGQVSLTVPIQDKYVVTIRKSGVGSPGQSSFGTASFIYTSGISGAEWRLRPAEVTTVDPASAITLQHIRTKVECSAARPRGSKVDWSGLLGETGLFDVQDGRGNSLSLADFALSDPGGVRSVTRLLTAYSPQLARSFFDLPVAQLVKQAAAEKIGHGRGTVVFDNDPTERPFVFNFKVLGDDGGDPTPFVAGALPCLNGVKVEIPANSLENPVTKKAPAGPVQVAVSAVDLSGPTQMPGDYSALDSGGKLASMESYGAGSVEIGSGTERFNLRSGATATVTIPVDATQLTGTPSLPTTIPFLFYDEVNGIWKQDGTAQLSGSGANAAYVATTSHFSTMNGDILKSGESCLAVEIDPAATFSYPLNVEVNLQPSKPNPTVVQVRTLTIASAGEHSVIYNLPNDKYVTLTPIVQGQLPDGSTGDLPGGIFAVNTGGPQNSPSAPPTPNADGSYYSEISGQPAGPCGARVVLKNLDVAGLSQPQAPYEFLQGLYFEASNINEFGDPSNPTTVSGQIVQGAKNYYIQADPRTHRPTLQQFKDFNRFGQPQNPPNEVEYSATYSNGGDLGFGREMHCRRNNAPDGKLDYACYVANYDQPPHQVSDQQAANDAGAHTNQPTDATVTMEYSRVESQPSDPVEFPDNKRAVKFYAYNTNTGNQVFAADLDGNGARPLPQLCAVCHGGVTAQNHSDPANSASPTIPAFQVRDDILNENSKFLPFDLHYFKFPTADQQQDHFRDLNIEIVKQVEAAIVPSGPIAELIDAWYPGGAGNQVDSAVIAGWNTGGATNPNHQDNQMYRDVYARACRTCHVAQKTFGATDTTLQFETVADFKTLIGTVQTRVCHDKVMPHGKRPNQIFWRSLAPNMASFLEIYGQATPGWQPNPVLQCGLFNSGNPGDVQSFFEGTVFPVLHTANYANSGCHSTVGNAQFSVTNSAATYTSLTTQLGTGGAHYIQAHDLLGSLLYQKLLNNPPPQMPFNQPAITNRDTNGNGVFDADDIANWITTFGAVGP